MKRPLMRSASLLILAAIAPWCASASAQSPSAPSEDQLLRDAAKQAERQLGQTFSNLQFEQFGPSPVRGPIYQANAGDRMVYYAPESEHVLFAAIYDRNGVNVTALAQDSAARSRLDQLDRSQALVIGPPGAPEVIEFTDPDCPYCRALDRFWATKAAEGKPVRRIIFFVSGIHPQAAAKAEHILCAAVPEQAFRALYGGQEPAALATCPEGHERLRAHDAAVKLIGLSGTPTLLLGGKLISGFQQAEIEAFLQGERTNQDASP